MLCFCPLRRPLFAQFCANDPETLLAAARHVEADCDYVDLNLGCPQHIAKRGRYGAFLMDDLPLVEQLVRHLASGLTTPVSCKIRVFPDLDQTLAYARMLQDAGCSLLAVHGRTRQQKDNGATRADWDAIRVRLPVPALGPLGIFFFGLPWRNS
jgi:tRNA-dihydrouridine synthase 1